MPIRESEKGRYPANWKEIRQQVLKRAGHKCEWCGKRNRAFYDKCRVHGWDLLCMEHECRFVAVQVVLTIAHLDHTPEHNTLDNLAALCQRCHNRYDAPMRAAGRKARADLARTKHQLPLLP